MLFQQFLAYSWLCSRLFKLTKCVVDCGKEKPSNSNSFLNNLVDEIKYVAEYDMDTDFGKRIVKVETFCCDTPAKSFILCTKGHVGYFSCSRCTIDGVRVNNTMSYLGKKFPQTNSFRFYQPY